MPYRKEEKLERDTEEAVKRLFTKWMITICRTSTVAVLFIATQVGVWIVSHFERVVKALDALFGGDK